MYALINTFHKDARHAGIIISRHRTERAAEVAADKHSRAVERANGAGSYIPTRIELVASTLRAGDWVKWEDIEGIHSMKNILFGD